MRPSVRAELERRNAVVVLVTVWKVRRRVGNEGKRIEMIICRLVRGVIWKT